MASGATRVQGVGEELGLGQLEGGLPGRGNGRAKALRWDGSGQKGTLTPDQRGQVRVGRRVRNREEGEEVGRDRGLGFILGSLQGSEGVAWDPLAAVGGCSGGDTAGA